MGRELRIQKSLGEKLFSLGTKGKNSGIVQEHCPGGRCRLLNIDREIRVSLNKEGGSSFEFLEEVFPKKLVAMESEAPAASSGEAGYLFGETKEKEACRKKGFRGDWYQKSNSHYARGTIRKSTFRSQCGWRSEQIVG